MQKKVFQALGMKHKERKKQITPLNLMTGQATPQHYQDVLSCLFSTSSWDPESTGVLLLAVLKSDLETESLFWTPFPWRCHSC